MAPEARRIADANSQCGTGAMSAGVQQRWIVLGADGRHMSLGRATPPTDMEIIGVSDALTAQGLSGWLARMQGEYYSRQKVTLEPLQRIGISHDADWHAALSAFHAARPPSATIVVHHRASTGEGRMTLGVIVSLFGLGTMLLLLFTLTSAA